MLYFELLLLVILFLVSISIVWFTLKTGISPMMSSSEACQVMLKSINSTTTTTTTGSLIDLGSGWGTLVIATARQYPNREVIGYELSWFPWFISVMRKYSLGLNNLTLYRKDFKYAKFDNASVLFCYLFTEAMVTLSEKLNKLNNEQFDSLLIVSNTFALPSYKPQKIIKLNDIYKTPIYIYCFKQSSSLN